MMEIFYQHLCSKLDAERPNWRSNTVVLHDNAPYCISEGAINVYRNLQIPMLFSGPHSYSTAPCELVFSLLKQKDINPLHIATGKK